MISANSVALYFLKKDERGELFTSNVVERNGRQFYDGNARLNKYLHLAQNVHIAMYGQCLFGDDLYAYDNGAVVVDVLNKYQVLTNRKNELPCDVQPDKAVFLDKIYDMLKNASIDELIEISHEDAEWSDKNKSDWPHTQIMFPLSRVDEYREQYSDVVALMGGRV